MALIVGEYLYKRLIPDAKEVHMNVTNMNVLHAQIAQKDTSRAQLLQIEAEIDLDVRATNIHWYNLSEDGFRSEESFASTTVLYEEPAVWRTEWRRATHLLNDRIEVLSRMAADGAANRLSKGMAYNLFKNVVDYAERYRGMQSVVLNEYEAFADITLNPDRHGNWHTPPHWIDSVFQLAGFVMNGSDACNTKDFFYITPGWSDLRWVRPFESGVRYRSYVRMFPAEDEPNTFAGDIYVIQGGMVVGMLGQIKFRRVPRLFMDRLFIPPDASKRSDDEKRTVQPVASTRPPTVPVSRKIWASKAATVVQKPHKETPATLGPLPDEKTPERTLDATKPATLVASNTSTTLVGRITSAPALVEEHPVIADCLRLIARETGLDVGELTDQASFTELGIDSLMSLVVSEKFRSELGIELKSSIFLECPSVMELKEWLEQDC
jgi:asperthecin polyketide synthase